MIWLEENWQSLTCDVRLARLRIPRSPVSYGIFAVLLESEPPILIKWVVS